MVLDGIELGVGARWEESTWDGIDSSYQVAIRSWFHGGEHHHFLDLLLLCHSSSVRVVVFL